MHIEDLATETLIQVFLSVPSVSTAVNLSSTCSRLRHIYTSSKRLLILSQAAEAEYGPLDEIVQLVTHNASQPAYIRREVPVSVALIRSLVKAGRVAAKYEDIYPFKKWKSDFENRRTLVASERFGLRKALYRLWLFSRAFHNADHHRLLRASPQAVYERASLLHNFSTIELAEMLDVHNILRDTVSRNICPSNGAVRTKVHKHFPDHDHQLLFNPRLNFLPSAPSPFVSEYYHSDASTRNSRCKYVPSRTHEPGAEGWGDEIIHYYVVEDMLKLDPEQILWLKENAPFKTQVEGYVRSMGDWFENNGETFVQTMQFVVQQRGEEFQDIKTAVEYGEMGIALNSRRDSVV